MAADKMPPLKEEMIDNLEDEDDALDLLIDYNINTAGVATMADARKKLRDYLKKQIKKNFKCDNCDIKDEDIEGVTSIEQARALLIHHRIRSETTQTIEEACDLLRTHLQDKMRLEPYDTEEVAKVVRKLVEENTQGRKRLLSKLTKVQQYLQKVPEQLKKYIEKQVPDLDEELESIETQLEDDNCTLMIAGETGAGKSCLLNLLLGEIVSELLAVNNLPSTSALCEIKYGNKELKAYQNSEYGSTAETVSLNKGDPADIIAQYVSKQGDRTDLKYKKVEVFWPVEWIKHGITITDTPGIGESEELTQVVKDYIPQAAGFIYVINTPNAGGINAEQLEDLLFYHITREGIADDPDLPLAKAQEKIKFDPRSAIFVCNKWDQVNPGEQAEIKRYVKNKLEHVWRDFDFDSQVFFISATQIAKELDSGYVSSEYRRLLAGIQNLLPCGFRNKMEKQFWRMYHIMDRATWVMKNYIILDNSETREQMKVQYKKAKEKLLELKKRPEKAKWQMKDLLNKQVNETLQSIKDHMTSEEVTNRITTWLDTDCPDNNNLDRLLQLQNAYALRRIKQEIHKFEEDNRKFENIQKLLIQKFQSIFVSVEGELCNIENEIKEEQGSLTSTFIKVNRWPTTTHTATEFHSNRNPVWAPLGVVINAFALPVVGLWNLKKQKKEKKLVEEYRQDKPKAMAAVTLQVMNELVNSRRLRDVIGGKLSLLNEKFSKLLNRIPQIIDANKELISNLEKELELSIDHKQFIPLYKEGKKLQDEMNFEYMCTVRSYDLDLDHIKDMKKIGEGAFANVYKGIYKRKGQKQVVAVKKFKGTLSEDNVTDFLNEELILMRIQSPHVVGYIGTCARVSGRMVFPAMVQEYCELSLDSVIYKPAKYKGPGKVTESDPQRSALTQKAAQFADEISMGLAAMHEQGLVHRDLKPENILVDVMSGKEKLKLCDLGMSTREKDITATYAGTPLYMAPEISQEKHYNRTADMFSLGLIFWELWYGAQIENAYTIDNYKSFCHQPFKRPHEPPKNWKDLMCRCWDIDSSKRPTPQECSIMFGSLYNK